MKALHALGAAIGAVLVLLAGQTSPAFAQSATPHIVTDAGASREAGPVSLAVKKSTGDCVAQSGCEVPVAQTFTDVSVNPAVTIGTYSQGNAVSGLQTVTMPSTTGRIEEVTLYAKTTQSAEIDVIWCGGQQPTSTTITDKAALSLNVADFAKCRQIAQLTNWRSLGTPSSADSGQVSIPYNLGGSSTTGYLALYTPGAPAFASTSDLTLTLRVAR
jgi:hypothetical protein